VATATPQAELYPPDPPNPNHWPVPKS
jgi:hypothetical protein